MSRNGDWGPRSALPTQGAPGAHLGLKSCCSFWYVLRYANPSHLRSILWKNTAIVRLGSVQEQAQMAKSSRSTCPPPPAAAAQARPAVGGALRGDDTPLAAGRQKYRW